MAVSFAYATRIVALCSICMAGVCLANNTPYHMGDELRADYDLQLSHVGPRLAGAGGSAAVRAEEDCEDKLKIVAFQGSGSVDADGRTSFAFEIDANLLSHWELDFGDETILKGKTSRGYACHSYAVCGMIEAKLTAYDQHGHQTSKTWRTDVECSKDGSGGAAGNAALLLKEEISVDTAVNHVATCDAPVINVFSAPASVEEGAAVPFEFDISSECFHGWTLNFGDSSSPAHGRAQVAKGEHTFLACGEYTAEITAEDAQGQTSSKQLTVSVTCKPTPVPRPKEFELKCATLDTTPFDLPCVLKADLIPFDATVVGGRVVIDEADNLTVYALPYPRVKYWDLSFQVLNDIKPRNWFQGEWRSMPEYVYSKSPVMSWDPFELPGANPIETTTLEATDLFVNLVNNNKGASDTELTFSIQYDSMSKQMRRTRFVSTVEISVTVILDVQYD